MVKYISESFISNIHTYLVFLVGIYLAVSRRKILPQVSVCVVAAIGMSFIAILIYQLANAIAGFWALQKSDDVVPLITEYLGYYKFVPYLNTGTWILLLFSAFAWRPQQKSTEGRELEKQPEKA